MTGLRLFLFCLVTIALPAVPQAHVGKVVIVMDDSSAIHARFQAALEEQWRASSILAGETLPERIHVDDDNASQLTLPGDADLVITVGSIAARAVDRLGPGKPVLNTIIPESVYLASATPDVGCNRHSAIFIDQPVDRQSRLAELIFPDRDEYGLLLGPVSARRRPEIEMLRTLGSQNMTIRIVARDESTMAAGRELLASSDLLLAINDPMVMNRENAKWLLYVAYQRRLPVIGFSRAYVRAGAAAAVYSDIEQHARQAVEIIADRSKQESACLPTAQYPKYFRVSVNEAVCRSLGGAVTDEKTIADLLRAGDGS